MNAEKNPSVNTGSLVELKAELARKQQEFKKEKVQQNTSYVKAKPTVKKKTIWSKQNAGVLERAQRDLEVKHEEENELEKSRQRLAAKTKLYEKMSQTNQIPDDEENNMYMVDFQKKVVDTIIEKRERQEEAENKRRAEAEKLKREEDEERRLLMERVPEPEDSEEQWVDYVDSFGRSRRCLRKDLPDLVKMDKKRVAGESGKPSDRPPDLMSGDMYREQLRKKWEEEEQEAMNKPTGPIHYAHVQHDEIRNHGVGFFKFSRDEETRQEEMEKLTKLREQTIDQRSRKDRIKEKRKAIMEARLAKVKQRKMIREGKSLSEDNEEQEKEEEDNVVGKEEKETSEPEPLVRDDSWRLKAPMREWDKGKKVIEPVKPVPSEEREPEFAPPSFYYEDQPKPVPNSKKYRKNSSKAGTSSVNSRTDTTGISITQGIRELRKEAEKSNQVDIKNIPLPPSDSGTTVTGAPTDTPKGAPANLPVNTELGYSTPLVEETEPLHKLIPQQLPPVGATDYSVLSFPPNVPVPPQGLHNMYMQGQLHGSYPPPPLPVMGGQNSYINQPPPTIPQPPLQTIPYGQFGPHITTPQPLTPQPQQTAAQDYGYLSQNITDPQLKVNASVGQVTATGGAVSYTLSNQPAGENNDRTSVKDNKPAKLDEQAVKDITTQALKGSVQITAKPVKYDVPRLPKPKYERVDMAALPMTLPAPPSAANTPVYPSQEEVFNLKGAGNNKEAEWKRQFQYQPPGGASAPSNIPFISPYVQKEDNAGSNSDNASLICKQPSKK